MKLDSLQALYEHELHDLQDAENQLIALLPRMAEAASDEKLKKHLRAHGQQARKHRDRLNSILDNIETEDDDVRCEGIRGISREAERLLGDDQIDGAVRDAALIAIAQKAEHYEMAGYGALRTYAEILGEDKARDILQKTLDEEGDADDHLTRIARESVNPAATA